MGSMLLNEFIASEGLKPSEIIVSTRTKAKLQTLKEKWNQINIAEDNREVVRSAKHIFICVKPAELKNILYDLKDNITAETHIISLAGTVLIKNIEAVTNGKVTKITPSITSEAHGGITLVCHNDKVTVDDAAFVEALLNKISTVKVLKEEEFDLAVDLTSCAPGFIAAIFREFLSAALLYNRTLTEAELNDMVVRTLSGTAKLFTDKGMSFYEVITRVATKGGITEEGVKVIRKGMPQVFEELFRETRSKRSRITETVNRDFQEF